MSSSKVTSKGQTTIPIEVRRHLRLKNGDRVHFTIQKNGQVAMTRKTVHIKDLYGLLAPAPRHATLEDMERGIREGAAEWFERPRH